MAVCRLVALTGMVVYPEDMITSCLHTRQNGKQQKQVAVTVRNVRESLLMRSILCDNLAFLTSQKIYLEGEML